MEATLRVLNGLVEAGDIEQYAIGGAFAALYYLEPFLTEDLDVFCSIASDASPLMPFAKAYNALQAEHLAAIALQTGRDKDFERVARFLVQTQSFDRATFSRLVTKYALADKLALLRARYPNSWTD